MIRFSLFISFLLLFSCESSTNRSVSTITIATDSIKHDSIGYRVINFIGGEEVVDTILPMDTTLVIHGLKEDMYLVVLSWPRTLIPHQLFRSKDFDPAMTDLFTLTKAIYIKPDESTFYKLSIESALSAEDIEVNGVKKLNINSGKCHSCALAEIYWDNYNTYFDRKSQSVDKLNEAFYKAIDHRDITARKKYLNALTAKNSLKTDSLFSIKLDSIVRQNAASPVSTFFVFYQLYTDRDFRKYKSIFEHLEGKAKKSKYYHTLVSKYQ